MYNPELMTAIYWSIQTVYVSRKHGFWLLPNKNPNYMLEKFVMVLSSLDIHGSKVFSNNHFKSLAMKRWLCSLVGGLPWRFDFALVTLTEANSHLSVILVHFFSTFSLQSSHLRTVFPLFHFFTFKNGLLSLFTLVTLNMVSPPSVVMCWTHLRLPGLKLSRDTSRNNNVHVLICYQSIITFWILFLEGGNFSSFSSCEFLKLLFQ